MKFTCTVKINQPISKVIDLWEDESKFSLWQDGFNSKTLLEGEKGKVGSKSKIILSQGRKSMELMETVLVNSLPKEFKTFVEHIHMDNTQTVRFRVLSKHDTEYSSEVEYTEFKHIIPKLLAKLFPGMFKKQVQKRLDQFKNLAENN